MSGRSCERTRRRRRRARAGARRLAAGTLREFKEWSERAFLVERLREHEWNISKTAEVIDTPRSNLYKKLEQYAHHAGVRRLMLGSRFRRSGPDDRRLAEAPRKGAEAKVEESPNSAGQCAG